MSLYGEYDAENIFAKIICGDAPCVKVHEDNETLSFMDVFPQTRGHTLVIPKNTSARNFLEFPQERIGPYMARVQTIAQAVVKALEPDGVRIMQFNGEASGQSVYHLHFHILPMNQGQIPRLHAGGPMADMNELKALADKIRAAL